MRAVTCLWIILAGTYCLFLAWHSSFQGPLTRAELAGYMARLSDEDLTGIEDPRSFFQSDDGREFYMFNMLEFRGGEERTSALAADKAYGEAILPLLLARGSYPVMVTDRIATFLNQTDDAAIGQFDRIALVRYRSRRDLLDMITSDDFNNIVHHKWASLERTIVAPTQRRLGVGPATLVPLVLVLLGLSATLVLARTSRPAGAVLRKS